jgi:hypothetical protein
MASTQQGLVIAGQKAGHPCPKTRLPSNWAEGQQSKAHILRCTFAKKAIQRCHSRPIGLVIARRVGTPMTIQNDHDHHSDYGPAQLALFVAAAGVLLVFAWTYIR